MFVTAKELKLSQMVLNIPANLKMMNSMVMAFLNTLMAVDLKANLRTDKSMVKEVNVLQME